MFLFVIFVLNSFSLTEAPTDAPVAPPTDPVPVAPPANVTSVPIAPPSNVTAPTNASAPITPPIAATSATRKKKKKKKKKLRPKSLRDISADYTYPPFVDPAVQSAIDGGYIGGFLGLNVVLIVGMLILARVCQKRLDIPDMEARQIRPD